ncbi:hypothetical protein AB1Y20_021410 [Prymnesium parvum]|uniref:Centrosomal protein of 162 kDa n=1 Tax=Prymnesium parvum TaxID=97485 RepID=A0AB34JK22_PRYPA
MAPASAASATPEWLHAEVCRLRTRISEQEELRLAERNELVASYEAMLAQQELAVRQHEAKACSLLPLRHEVRQREAEVRQLTAASAASRQHAHVVSKVWRASVSELEGALELQLKQKEALEAERHRFAEGYRKKLAQLQKEADQRHAEVRRMAEKEESAMEAAAAAAGRQAERAFEAKAREVKHKAEAALQRERQQQAAVVSQLKSAAEVQAARHAAEVEAAATLARREWAERLHASEAAREEQLARAAAERDALVGALRRSLRELEEHAASEVASAVKASVAAAAAAAEAAEREARGAREATQKAAALSRELKLAQQRAAEAGAARERVVKEGKQQLAAAHAEAKEAAEGAAAAHKARVGALEREAAQLREAVARAEETAARREEAAGRAARERYEGEKAKLGARHKAELARQQGASDERRAEEIGKWRERLERANRQLAKASKEASRGAAGGRSGSPTRGGSGAGGSPSRRDSSDAGAPRARRALLWEARGGHASEVDGDDLADVAGEASRVEWLEAEVDTLERETRGLGSALVRADLERRVAIEDLTEACVAADTGSRAPSGFPRVALPLASRAMAASHALVDVQPEGRLVASARLMVEDGASSSRQQASQSSRTEREGDKKPRPFQARASSCSRDRSPTSSRPRATASEITSNQGKQTHLSMQADCGEATRSVSP